MQNYYLTRNWKCWPQSNCPAYSPVREAKTMISRIFPTYRKGEQKWSDYVVKVPALPQSSPRRGGRFLEFQMNGAYIIISKTLNWKCAPIPNGHQSIKARPASADTKRARGLFKVFPCKHLNTLIFQKSSIKWATAICQWVKWLV